jgi:hypothetical protein
MTTLEPIPINAKFGLHVKPKRATEYAVLSVWYRTGINE